MLNTWSTYSKKLFKKERVFLAEKYILDVLDTHEAALIDQAKTDFKDRFSHIYNSQLANMKLLKSFLVKQKFNKTLLLLKKIYGEYKPYSTVYLCLSQNANVHAGGMVLADTVLLDFGDWKLDKDGNTPLLHTLLHELAHDANLSQFLPKKLSLRKPTHFTGNAQEFFDECIHHALLSEKGLVTNQQDKKLPNFFVRGSKEPYLSIERASNTVAPILQKALFSKVTQPKILAKQLLNALLENPPAR